MSVPFPVPVVCSDQWGPDMNIMANPNEAAVISKYAALPYAPFGRSDRLGRAADFTAIRGGAGGGPGTGGTGGGGYFGGGGHFTSTTQPGRGGGRRVLDSDDEAAAAAAAADQQFQLVDTTKAASSSKRFVNPASKRRQHSQRLRQINARRQQHAPQQTAMDKMTRGGGGGGGGPSGGGGPGRGARPGRGGGAASGGRHSNYSRIDRQPSVAVQSDWSLVEEFDLGKLTKHLNTSAPVPSAEDVLWCGFLDPYNEAYDKVTARQPVPLKRMEQKEFYYVTTTDDPVLQKLAIEDAAQVFITDAVLSHLMTCTRSVYPWDIVIQKLPSGTLFFDKRDNSQFDFLTVHETAYHPPSEEGEPERLALEATLINQNFSQQILRKAGRRDLDLPNPFFDEDDAEEGTEPASVAYRYRKFAFDDKLSVICRTELHGVVKKTQYVTAFALNEYIPNSTAVTNPNATTWRDKMDAQRGAILATELKNNSFKLAKWTAQSLLAGADQMKIGFVTRSSPRSSFDHVILGTQFYRPKEFATQITLSESQMWAMFRMFIAVMHKQKQHGKYVLMRDPNKALLQLYRVPDHTFEEQDDEEDDQE